MVTLKSKNLIDEHNVRGVHFKTSVAQSYLVLEEAASIPRPGLRHRNFRTIREFVLYLQGELPGITDEMVNNYIGHYERARFSDECFSAEDYADFMGVILEIVERIQ